MFMGHKPPTRDHRFGNIHTWKCWLTLATTISMCCVMPGWTGVMSVL